MIVRIGTWKPMQPQAKNTQSYRIKTINQSVVTVLNNQSHGPDLSHGGWEVYTVLLVNLKLHVYLVLFNFVVGNPMETKFLIHN